MFFAPTSVPPPPICLALFCAALWFSGASDSFGSLVPFAMWSPFGTSQGCYSLCSLGFGMPTCGDIHSVFVSAPFLCLVRIWSSLSDVFAHWVASGFLWCSVQLDFWFFLATIPIPTSLSSFRPSGSSLVSFRSYSLRSILSFWLYIVLCLLFVSSFQFMILSSFVGHSLSVPSPPVSRCFRVRLLQSVTRSDLWFYLSDGVARWDESLLFAPSCSTPVVRQTLVCRFMFFLLGSVSRIFSLPSSFCMYSFRFLYW